MASERIVRVTIAAEVNSYLKGIDEVSKKTREGAKESELLTRRLEAQQKMFTAVGAGMLTAGGVIAAGLILATKRAAEFDQAMSNVQAATHESAENMGLLRDAALEAGADTVYSAKEAAGAIEELAKAGLSTQSIIGGGLTGALDLAAAGGLDVADAAGIASTTLQQFGLSGDKASHVADVLAAGAGKAMGDVSDLSMALSQSGTVAAQFGLSLEETTGSLAAFASKGLLGSDAGTSFRSMLLRLANPTGEAADKMRELGIQAYDAQGNFVGMTGLAGQLEKGLGKLTQEQRNAALSIIFGQDAIRAANVLYAEGAKGIAQWTQEVDDAGYAGETAAARLDNLNGDLEKLSGAFDTAMITIGSAGQGPLRAAVQGITELVDGFNGMPEGAQTAVYWVGAVAAAGALAGGAFLLAVPKVAAYRVAIQELGAGAQAASRALGTLARVGTVGAVIGGAVVGVDALSNAIAQGLLPSAEKIDNQMRSAKSGVDLFAAALNSEGITNTQQASKLLKGLGGELDAVAKSDFWNPRSTSGTAVTVATKLADIANSGDMAKFSAQFRRLAEDADLTEAQISTFITTNGPLSDALTKQATAAGLTADAQTLVSLAMGRSGNAAKTASDAYLEQADAANGVRDALKQLYDQMNAANSAQQTAIQANADFQQGLSEIAAKATEMGTSLDEATAAGSANAAMLAGIAGDAQAAAAAQYEVDQSTMSAKDATDRYSATLADQRQKFIDSAVSAGYNADEVQKLADKVFALPSSKEIKILAETAQAQNAINRIISDNDGRRITLNVVTNESRVVFSNGNVATSRATGGILPGPPSSKDNMLLHAASGEFIVRASQTAIPSNRAALEYINAGGVIRGFANGGYVQPQYASGSQGARMTPQMTVSAPEVRVFIGDDEVTSRVRVVVRDELDQVARVASFGGGW